MVPTCDLLEAQVQEWTEIRYVFFCSFSIFLHETKCNTYLFFVFKEKTKASHVISRSETLEEKFMSSFFVVHFVVKLKT